MKRARNKAVVISSGSEDDEPKKGSDSDYEPEENPSPKKIKKEPAPKTEKIKKAPAPKTDKKTKVNKDKKATKPKSSSVSLNELDEDLSKNDSITKTASKKPPAIKKDNPSKSSENQLWVPSEVLARDLDLDFRVSDTVCRLLDDGNSIPFLARYRREQTGGMEPETLRQFKDSYDTLRSVKEKCGKILASVEKLGKLVPVLKNAFLSAQSIPELEHLFTPFKPGSKSSLAERARKLGFENIADEILGGKNNFWDLSKFVDSKTKGKTNIEEVGESIRHIIADLIVHDKDTVDFVRTLRRDAHIVIESKRAKATKSTKTEKSASKEKDKKAAPKKDEDPSKYETYFEFSCPAKFIKAHQVLALNRGEANKVLSVKVNIPDWFERQLQGYCRRRWLNRGANTDFRTKMVLSSLEDGYKRLLHPLISRQTRAELSKNAEDASILVFLENLRKLLLTPPLRGKTILSIDPGFGHGCKVAVLSGNGSVLDTAVVHPNFQNPDSAGNTAAGKRLQALVVQHKVSTICIGNGTACRETEAVVSALVSKGAFSPCTVNYTIVNEQGASIYSCSPVAAAEFPGMDTNIVSSVSIGRRLQDPLSEYVKIEPQHLGVGMYQHDVSQAKLREALDEIVVECVSFVGVDVNSCSEHLLRRVAGLNTARVKAIIDYRTKNTGFTARDQLKNVKGIGDKVFQQCAGFIRIGKTSETCQEPPSKKSKLSRNLLDGTTVHPESYDAAYKLIQSAGCDISDLGKPGFIGAISRYAASINYEKLVQSLGIGKPTLELILAALQQHPDYDYRAEFEAPLFRSGMTKMEDVKAGSVLTGKVTNVTHFGAFIDVGLGRAGLIHSSKMKGNKLELGQRLEVKVLQVDMDRGRIGLELLRIL